MYRRDFDRPTVLLVKCFFWLLNQGAIVAVVLYIIYHYPDAQNVWIIYLYFR